MNDTTGTVCDIGSAKRVTISLLESIEKSTAQKIISETPSSSVLSRNTARPQYQTFQYTPKYFKKIEVGMKPKNQAIKVSELLKSRNRSILKSKSE